MPNGKGAYRIDFRSFDFTGITPMPGDRIKWHSRQKWRRKNGACSGAFVRRDPDGWFVIRYTFGAPGAYKSRTVRIEPAYVIDLGR